MNLLNGNEVSQKIKLEIKAKVEAMKAAGKKSTSFSCYFGW